MINVVKEFRGHYAFLSNFAAVQIKSCIADAVQVPPGCNQFLTFTFNSVEAAYIAHKSTDLAWWQLCSEVAPNRVAISELKQAGKTMACLPHWDIIKDAVMFDLLAQKFSQADYKGMLLDTVGMTLEEGNTWKDDYWGIDRNRRPERGLNKLGKMLMMIRDNLERRGETRGPLDPIMRGFYRGTFSS